MGDAGDLAWRALFAIAVREIANRVRDAHQGLETPLHLKHRGCGVGAVGARRIQGSRTTVDRQEGVRLEVADHLLCEPRLRL